MRLVDGRVSVIIHSNNGFPNPLFKLFAGLGLEPTGRGRLASISVDLTPLGFEFDAGIKLPFAPEVEVKGRFCLTQERIGIWDENSPSIVSKLCLRKLADPTPTSAWNTITALLAQTSAAAAKWSSIETRAGAHAPTLRWAVRVDPQLNFQIDKNLLDLSPDALTFIFSSSASPALRIRRPTASRCWRRNACR